MCTRKKNQQSHLLNPVNHCSLIFILSFCFLGNFLSCGVVHAEQMHNKDDADKKEKDSYQEYIDFFEEIYKTMEDNYYQAVPREKFDHFVEQFDSKIYEQLKSDGKSLDYIRWRSASFLVKALKTQEDIFSEFYPPKPAKKYKQTALGKRVDLGI